MYIGRDERPQWGNENITDWDSTYDWQSSNFGSTSIRIDDSPTATYYIQIYAGGSAAFELTASTSNTSQILTEGNPIVVDSLTGSDKNYYVFYPSVSYDAYTKTKDILSNVVSIHYATYIGHLISYVSVDDNNRFPTAAKNDYNVSITRESSGNSRADAVSIPLSDICVVSTNPATVSCTGIYITLRPANENDGQIESVSYALVAYQNDIVELVDGVATQSELTAPGAIRYFMFLADDDTDEITFSLTALSTLPTWSNDEDDVTVWMFVSSNEEPSPDTPASYQKATHLSTANAELSLSKTDDAKIFCLNTDDITSLWFSDYETSFACVYWIAVYATSGATTAFSEDFDFEITVTTTGSYILLADGIPTAGYIDGGVALADAWAYYLYRAYNMKDALEIEVNSLTGDADLYVRKGTETMVNHSNPEWASTSYGVDIVAIYLENSSNPNAGLGMYQIGVYCNDVLTKSSECEFEITAWQRDVIHDPSWTDDPSMVYLLDGITQFDYLDQNYEVQFYQFDVSYIAANVPTFLLVDLECTFDVHTGEIAALVNQNTIPETNVTWDWGQLVYPNRPVTAEVKNISLDTYKDVIIAVQAYADDTLYEVTCNYARSIVELSVGTTEADSIMQSRYNFYTFQISDTNAKNAHLYITLESLSDVVTSAPYFYLSRYITRPTVNDTHCSSKISALMGYTTIDDESVACNYAMDNHASDKIRSLQFAQVNNSMIAGTWYLSTLMDASDVTLDSGFEQIFEISIESTFTDLENDESITETIVATDVKYYAYDMSVSDVEFPLSIALSVLSGDVVAYVTNDLLLSWYHTDVTQIPFESQQLKSNHTLGILTTTSQFVISKSNLFYCRLCVYYVLIEGEGTADSIYELTAKLQGKGMSELSDSGAPMGDTLLASQTANYYYAVIEDEQWYISTLNFLQISIEMISGNTAESGTVNVYVSKQYLYPNATDNEWSITGLDITDNDDFGMILITKNSGDLTAGNYFIAVECSSPPSQRLGDIIYSIMVTTDRIVLLEDFPSQMEISYNTLMNYTVGFGGVIYYEFDVMFDSSDEYSSRTIQFEISSQYTTDVWAVIVTNSELQSYCTAANYCPQLLCDESTECTVYYPISGNNYPVVIESTDIAYCSYEDSSACTYYLAVYYLEELSTSNHAATDIIQISVTASSTEEGSALLLFDADSVTRDSFIGDFSSEDRYKYYQTSATTAATGLQVTLQMCWSRSQDYSVDVDLYMSQSAYYPTASNYVWRSANSDRSDVITIIAGSSAYIASSPYYVGVKLTTERNNDVDTSDNDNIVAYEISVGYPTVDFEPSLGDIIVSSQNIGEATVSFDIPAIDITSTLASEGLSHIAITSLVLYFANESNPYSMFTECGLSLMSGAWLYCDQMSSTLQSCSVDLFSDDTNVVLSMDDDGNANGGEITIDGLRPTEKYYFNIVVGTDITFKPDASQSDDTVSKSLLTAYRYATTTISDSNGGMITKNGLSKSAKTGMWIGIPLFILLVIVSVYLCYRNRRMRKELEIVDQMQMDDVPISAVAKAISRGTLRAESGVGDKKKNVGRIGSSGRKKYSNLLVDDEFISDDGDSDNGGNEDEPKVTHVPL